VHTLLEPPTAEKTQPNKQQKKKQINSINRREATELPPSTAIEIKEANSQVGRRTNALSNDV